MIVHYSEKARETILNYYENYIVCDNFPDNTDMKQRANNYSRISTGLLWLDFEMLQQKSYQKDNRNFIDIDDICAVEYQIKSNNIELIIMDIYFK
ncbi:hypothetical protein FACS189474_3080 [Bacteroidia bacterium]|nr:hypothetical protein FACS189474_3080 [Bacteroidia bacterium]